MPATTGRQAPVAVPTSMIDQQTLQTPTPVGNEVNGSQTQTPEASPTPETSSIDSATTQAEAVATPETSPAVLAPPAGVPAPPAPADATTTQSTPVDERAARRIAETGISCGQAVGLVPATGHAVVADAVSLLTFRDGLLSEYRVQPDRLGVLQQIGAVPG